MKPSLPWFGQSSRSGADGRLSHVLAETSLERLTGSLKKQWKRYHQEQRRCQSKLSEKAIHASRVETRKLIASAELLGGFVAAGRLKKAQSSIKDYLDNFDDLRDTHVQLPSVAKLLRRFPAARPFNDYLLKREKQLEKSTRKRIKRIEAGRLAKVFAKLRKDVEAALTRCGSTKATALIVRSVNRAFDRTWRLRKAINSRDTRSIHRTRVSFKKFRYMVEALAEYLPDVTDDYLEELRHYQTMMGEIQDAEVLLGAFDKFRAKKEMSAGAARRFRAELLRRRQWWIRVYLDSANQLSDFWPLGAQRRPGARA